MFIPLFLLVLYPLVGAFVAKHNLIARSYRGARTIVPLEPVLATLLRSTASTVDAAYGSDSITVLKGLEPVRKRPGMYIGNTGSRGLHHLVFEVVDNSVDEALAGHCTEITITMHADGSIEVQDNGRGIPCAVHPSTGKSSLETVLCVLHAGGKFGGDASGYKVSGGLHGVGLSVVNALSESLAVEVVRDNTFHTMMFAQGNPTTELQQRPARADERRGTKVTFRPDPSIFKTTLNFEFDKLASRLDELAYLNAGLTIHLIDKRPKLSAAAAQAIKVSNRANGEYSDVDVDVEGEGGAEETAALLPPSPPAVGAYKLGGQKKAVLTGATGATSDDSIISESSSTFTTSSTTDNKASATDSDTPTKEVTFRHDGGIRELVQVLCEGKSPLLVPAQDTTPAAHTAGVDTAAAAGATSGSAVVVGKTAGAGEVIYISQDVKGVAVQVALRWSRDSYADSLQGFANGIRTADGGSHLDGLKSAVTKTVNAFARKTGKIKDISIPGEYIREGLTAVVSVKVAEPEFEGQTKTRLGNPEVRQIVDSVVSEHLHTLFEWQPALFTALCNKALAAQAASVAAKAAREMVRRKSLLTSTILPGKLSDCASRNPAECEIYIVEGDSAAGSAKLGRDRRTQAILPLKGKILNIEKASSEKIYQNAELQALISALGLGVKGAPFDPDLLRYHRIVIMTDADVDGAHIRLLLLTFFYRYQRELLTKGYVYIACPPLYKVVSKSSKGAAAVAPEPAGTSAAVVTKAIAGKTEAYLYDQAAMDAYMRTLSDPAPQIQRFKGLGEMMPVQLWDTTMDPARRTLKQVTIEDAQEADKMFSMLMGDDVLPRKDFIMTHAEDMSISDLDY